MPTKKTTLLNIITSIILQITTIVMGFIIPKIILEYFGSEANGLVTSLNQFLSYITLIEGGITGVISASLYKPLIENDDNKISSIIKTSTKFYQKIGLIFILYSLVLAIVYPLIFKTSFSYIFILSLTIILGINIFIQYMFSLTSKTLLNASKKVHITSIVQIVIQIITIILIYLSLKVYPSLHILKLISGILFLIQPLVFNHYINKHYKLDKKAKVDLDLIKNRWNGFAVNIAAFIHFSTDTTILSIFTNLTTVSVYNVYSLVTSGLRSIINSIANAITPTIGEAYAKGDINNLNLKLDLFEYIIITLVFYLLTVASLLIYPFVMLYTKNINDANYHAPIFGILLIISEAIYLIKIPHLSLAYSANKFKEITKPAFIEAFINIIVSAILVIKMGLIGVAIGTIFGMLYRLIFTIKFTKTIISNRKIKTFYSKTLIYIIFTIIGLVICNVFIPVPSYTFKSWFIHAIIYSLLFIFIYYITSIIFFKKELKYIKNYLRKKV